MPFVLTFSQVGIILIDLQTRADRHPWRRGQDQARGGGGGEERKADGVKTRMKRKIRMLKE